MEKGIHLGRLWNKYLIVEILAFAAEEHALAEAEAALWGCSHAHRLFLVRNRDWYPV